jgi:hypothetical protein
MADPLVCYLVSNNVVTSTNQYFPCGNSDITGASAQTCCNGEDYCMDNSICHYTRGGVTNGTGYYMGGCTDPTWKDPACPKQCSKFGRISMDGSLFLQRLQPLSLGLILSTIGPALSGDAVIALKTRSIVKVLPNLLSRHLILKSSRRLYSYPLPRHPRR